MLLFDDRRSLNRIKTLLIIAVLAWLAWGYYQLYLRWSFDDAFIVYRIVRNILEGHGWVYNIGETHNASTSVLHTFLLAILTRDVVNVQQIAHLIGGLAIWGSALLAYALFRRDFGPDWPVLAGAALIVVMGRNGSWGLEVNLFIFLLLLFILLERYEKNSWPLLGLLVLTRPDGALLVGLKWLRQFIADRSYSLLGLAQVGLIMAPWIVYALYHFGRIFPDTMSQKMWQGSSGHWGMGFIYLQGLLNHYILDSSWVTKIALVMAVIALVPLIRERHPLLYLVAFAALQNGAYMVLNVPPYHWYFAYADAALCLTAVYGVGKLALWGWERYMSVRPLPEWNARFNFTLGLLLPVGALAVGLLTLQRDKGEVELDFHLTVYAPIMQEIDATYGPGRLATLEVGLLGYNTRREIVDIVGLTTAQGQFTTMDRMDQFYADPPELLLLHAPIWAPERAIVEDYRFPFVYDKVESFYEFQPPMDLYLRRADYNLAGIGDILAETYPAFLPDGRFSVEEIRPLSQGRAHLDHVNGYLAKNHDLIVNQRLLMHIQGWAVDVERRQTPEKVYVLLGHESGVTYTLAANRVQREDVARFLRSPDYMAAGFLAVGLTDQMPSGLYAIAVAQLIEGEWRIATFDNTLLIPD